MRALIAIAFLVLPCSLAHADDRAKAELFFRIGEQAFRKQKYAEAATSFEEAYKAAPIAELAFSAAQSYRRQFFIDREPKRDIAERAIELYRIYLDTVKSEGRRGDAAEGIAEMKRELDKLPGSSPAKTTAPAATRVAVGIVVAGEESKMAIGDLSQLPASDVGSAKAMLDGKPVDVFTQVVVPPGEHTAEVTADGYFPGKKTKRIYEGTNDVLEVVLQPKPAKLVVRTDGDVTIDGLPSKRTNELSAGKHALVVTRRGHQPIAQELTLGRGEEKIVDITLERTRQRRAVRYVLIGSGALATASLAATVFALYYDAEMRDIEDERQTDGIDRTQLARYHRVTDHRDFARGTAFVFGGAALLGAGVAAALWYFDEPRAEGVRVIPTGSGITVGGRF